MHWIWFTGRENDDDITIDELPATMVNLSLEFGTGERQIVKVDQFVVNLRADQQGRLNDALYLCGGVLMSPKLRAAVEQAGVANIQWFPVVIVPPGSENIKGYSLANVLGHVPCVDKEHSRLQFNPDDGEIEFIDSLALNEASFGPQQHLVRISEFLPLLVASEALKTAVERIGATGVKFINPKDFVL